MLRYPNGLPRLTLRYNATYTEYPWRSVDSMIDDAATVSHVRCLGDDHAHMHISFTTLEAMEREELVESMLLVSTARKEVACSDFFLRRLRDVPPRESIPKFLHDAHGTTPLYRRIKAIVHRNHEDNSTIVLTEAVSPFDFFKDAQVKVKVHALPKNASRDVLTGGDVAGGSRTSLFLSSSP